MGIDDDLTSLNDTCKSAIGHVSDIVGFVLKKIRSYSYQQALGVQKTQQNWVLDNTETMAEPKICKLYSISTY